MIGEKHLSKMVLFFVVAQLRSQSNCGTSLDV